MRDQLRVRAATAADVPALARLRRDFTFEDESPGIERDDFEDAFAAILESGLRAERWMVWVAEIGDEIVSHAFVGLIDKIPRPKLGNRWIGYLTNVYTRPAHRNQGIGGRVLEAAKEWAIAADVELLFVWPSEESTRFYRRHGFEGAAEPLVWTSPRARE